MKHWKAILSLSALIGLFISCDFLSNGGGTEAEGLSGQLVNPQGTPVSGASVRIYALSDTATTTNTGAAKDSTLTDGNGRFRFSKLPNGRYNIESSLQKDGSTHATFIPDVLVKGNLNLGADTLRVTGNILASVKSDGAFLEGAQCYIPGSSRIAISDDSGQCLITEVPRGIFRVRFRYEGLLTVTSNDIVVQSAATTNVGTFTLVADPALAPPTPSGISARYDSTSGITTLKWNSVHVSDLAGYVVYRRQSLGETPVKISLSLLADTMFKDTLSRGSGDSLRALFLYQIKAQDNDGNLSLLYSSPAGITAIPPVKHGQYFSLTSSTVALWTFNSRSNGGFPDASSHGFNLTGGGNVSLATSPYDSAAIFFNVGYLSTPNNSAFTVSNSGKITYEARIFMNQYPSIGNFKGITTLMGMYEGLALQIRSDGALFAKTQKIKSSGSYWYDTISSAPAAIPLNQWVNVALSIDASTSPTQIYGYVNGIPIQLYGSANADPFRISTSTFAIGNDTKDNQPFIGKIDEIRVSSDLTLGSGLPIATRIAAPTALTYSSNPVTYTVGTAIGSNNASNTGGHENLSYSIFSGSLPSGLSLNANTGAITGTPTTTGSFSPIIKVQNISGSDTEKVAITVQSVVLDTTHHFSLNSSTVALWRFNARSGGVFQDASPNAFNLSNANNFTLAASPFDSAVVFTGSQGSTGLSHANIAALNISGTGKMTLEGRIYITQYPPLITKSYTIIGSYDGLSLEILTGGILGIGRQKIKSGTGYWDTFRSATGAVPLNRWVDIAVSFDNSTGQAYGYIDESPVQLYTVSGYPGPNTDPWRTATSIFEVGAVPTDNQPFAGQMEEVRVSNNLVYGAGLPLKDSASLTPSDTTSYFGINGSTVALWKFNTRSGGIFRDASLNAFNLSNANNFTLAASPYDSSVVFTGASSTSIYPTRASTAALNVAGTGKVTYEARVYMTQYTSIHNASQGSFIIGTYESNRLMIWSDGSLEASSQKLNGGTGYWWGAVSDPGIIPLNRWVNLAVAFDQATGHAYGYIDGVPIQLHSTPATNPFRLSSSNFSVGNSTIDNQSFNGQIDEIRVSNDLILGTTLPDILPARSPLPAQ